MDSVLFAPNSSSTKPDPGDAIEKARKTVHRRWGNAQFSYSDSIFGELFLAQKSEGVGRSNASRLATLLEVAATAHNRALLREDPSYAPRLHGDTDSLVDAVGIRWYYGGSFGAGIGPGGQTQIGAVKFRQPDGSFGELMIADGFQLDFGGYRNGVSGVTGYALLMGTQLGTDTPESDGLSGWSFGLGHTTEAAVRVGGEVTQSFTFSSSGWGVATFGAGASAGAKSEEGAVLVGNKLSVRENLTSSDMAWLVLTGTVF